MMPPDEAWPDALEPSAGQLSTPEADPLDRIGRLKKAATAFRTISEVADDLHVPQHVLRFWETRFPQVTPLKRGGGRRYYRPDDVVLLRRISDLLYIQGYTIKGVQRLLADGDGSLDDELPQAGPADGPDHASVPDPAPDEEQRDPPPEDHRDPAGDELLVLRGAFRETLSVILAELEAIRGQLPD